MKNIQELEQCVRGVRISQKLLSLWEFNEKANRACFSESFEFRSEPEKFGLRTYSEEDLFLKSIVQFAQADASGSFYAFWIRKNDLELEDIPIVLFGHEGGYHIVAKGLSDFFHLLAYDVEPMVDWDGVTYCKGEDYQQSEKHESFARWLRDEYGFDEFLDPEEIIHEA